jgi:hypothetical protein
LQLLDKILHRGGAAESAGAFCWSWPKAPFDARMIGAEKRARRENQRQPRKGCAQKDFWASRGEDKGKRRDRDRSIIGNALFETEVARQIAESLEEKRSRNRCNRNRQYGESNDKGRSDARHARQITRAAIQKPTTTAAARIAKNQPKYLSSRALTGSP